MSNKLLFFYLFRDRLDGVIKANTVLIHHPQSFLEGLLKATANSHHLTCQQTNRLTSIYSHRYSVLMQQKGKADISANTGSSFQHQSIKNEDKNELWSLASHQHSSWSCQSWWKPGGTC